MDTTENKTEQYTKKPYPEFKPETDVIKHYMTDVGHDVAYNPITGHWFTGTRIKRPTWFMELSPPMEVKDAELRQQIIDELINTPHSNDFIEAVKVEMAHHYQKWGDESNKPFLYFANVLTFLLGKMIKCYWDADAVKTEHHITTIAAVAGTCHKYFVEANNIKEFKGTCTEDSQLQPPVISAEEYLKEKGISNKVVGQTNQYKEVRIVDLLTEYLQRQGQKTNQNKLGNYILIPPKK